MASKKRKFIKYTFAIKEGHLRDALIANLAEFPFEGLLEEIDNVQAFVSNNRWMPEDIDRLNTVSTKHEVNFDIAEVPYENWNKEWEKNFPPVLIPKVAYIRATFHDKIKLSKGEIEIIIDPKMAFGTGHHATTKLMLEELKKMRLKDKRILDFGAGTGILSIAAIKEGAKKVHAVEIERDAFVNMNENLKLNKVSDRVKTVLGDKHDIPDKKYDVILANVNKNVLEKAAKTLYKRCRTDGYILLSGILEDDKKDIISTYQDLGFKGVSVHEENDWLLIRMRKK